MAIGKVYLVGSGPGGLGYLTVQGRNVLTQAQAVVYDALVDEQVLEVLPEECDRIYVGKRGGVPSPTQAEIDRLLVQLCRQGKQVVRLKSGDPFIFGRSLSELQTLINADCAVEVIPGISSALAAPLLAGIPLTDPVLSRCFAVVTAHETDALNWEALSRIDTLVILMGGRNLSEIVTRLQEHGRSPHLPIAVIRWAGQPEQRIWVGTLGTILQQTKGEALSPCVIVVGDVVSLRSFLLKAFEVSATTELIHEDNFQPTQSLHTTASDNHLKSSCLASHAPASTMLGSDALPLSGKTILVTRAAGQSGQFTQLLQNRGATVIEMPALEIGPPSNWDALDAAIAQIDQFDWLILTSTNGVDYFFERLFHQQKDARTLQGLKIAVVGQKTAAVLQSKGIQADFIPPDFVADALVAHFPEQDLAGKRLLFPRVETGGREVLVKEFTSKGAIVTEVAAYQSGCPQVMSPEAFRALEQKKVDVVTFASSKTVYCFVQLLSTVAADFSQLLESVIIASIGPQTTQACVKLLGHADIEATEYTLEGLAEAIANGVTVPSSKHE